MMGRNRFLSSDSVTLEEAITAYEKLKKGRDFPKFLRIVSEAESQEESNSGTNSMKESSSEPELHCQHNNVGGGKFSKGFLKHISLFQHYNNSKYSYYSAEQDLLQGACLDQLSPNYMDLLTTSNFWLNIKNPDDDDISFLRQTFDVSDIVLSELQEGNAEEKVETFRQHTFISFRLIGQQHDFGSHGMGCSAGRTKDSHDMAFNMILFKDFIITTHNNSWESIPNILSFISMICKSGKEELKPEWVLFSILVELSQDGKFLLDIMEPEIDNIRIGSKSLAEMSNVMRRNFDMEFQIYKINAFISPKVEVLRQLLSSSTHSSRISEKMQKHLKDCQEDFLGLLEHLKNFTHIVERSQDTILALANVEHARLANGLAIAMNRIGEIALVFLPVQALAGFFGMNVKVPFQSYESTTAFWCILLISFFIAVAVYMRSRSLSVKSEVTPLPVKLRGDLLHENDSLITEKSHEHSAFKGGLGKSSKKTAFKLLKCNPVYSRVASICSNKTTVIPSHHNDEQHII